MDHQTRLFSILIIFVGLVGGYAVYSGIGPGVSGLQPLADHSKDTLSQFSGLNFNFSVFSSPDMQALRKFGEAPVTPGATGKNDLFAPF